jgi:hypothetical protein
MKLLPILIFSFTLCSCFNKRINYKQDYLDKFKQFALTCRPIYCTKTDTFGVAAIPVPDEKMNKCLLELSKESSAYKEVQEYAFLIMMKVYFERLRKSPTAYFLLNEHNKYENCVEVICLEASKLKKKDFNRDTYVIDLSGFYSYLKSKDDVKLNALKEILQEIDKESK